MVWFDIIIHNHNPKIYTNSLNELVDFAALQSTLYFNCKCFTTNSLEGKTVLNKYDHEAIKTRTKHREIMELGRNSSL